MSDLVRDMEDKAANFRAEMARKVNSCYFLVLIFSMSGAVDCSIVPMLSCVCLSAWLLVMAVKKIYRVGTTSIRPWLLHIGEQLSVMNCKRTNGNLTKCRFVKCVGLRQCSYF